MQPGKACVALTFEQWALFFCAHARTWQEIWILIGRAARLKFFDQAAHASRIASRMHYAYAVLLG